MDARTLAEQIEKKYGNCCGDRLNIMASELAGEIGPFLEQQWIKITDDPQTLPKIEDGHVAVVMDGEKTTHAARLVKHGPDDPLMWLWDNDITYPLSAVTHWQLLPAPPPESENA